VRAARPRRASGRTRRGAARARGAPTNWRCRRAARGAPRPQQARGSGRAGPAPRLPARRGGTIVRRLARRRAIVSRSTRITVISDTRVGSVPQIRRRACGAWGRTFERSEPPLRQPLEAELGVLVHSNMGDVLEVTRTRDSEVGLRESVVFPPLPPRCLGGHSACSGRGAGAYKRVRSCGGSHPKKTPQPELLHDPWNQPLEHQSIFVPAGAVNQEA